MKPDETSNAANPTDDLPDPSGPPRPVNKTDPVVKSLTTVGIGITVVGSLMFLVTANTTGTMGATRSTKLEFEARAEQIAQASKEDEAYRQRELADQNDAADSDPLR